MDTAKINLYLDEAFNYWLRLIGLTGAESRWSFENWDLKEQTRDIQESRRRDPTGLTSFMLMKAFVKEYLSAEKFSAWDLLRGLSEEQQERVDLLREVYDFLQQPEIEGYVDTFIDDLRLTTKAYGIDHEDLESWLTDRYWMSILRRDALKSFELLEAHQFCFGEPGIGTPSYGTKVLEFWNVPSLVRAMAVQGRTGFRGVHLCLIRDPEFELESFFVLAVVNGESMTILTDRAKHAHPGAKEMKSFRRPDKAFRKRAAQHWFPYELLDLEVVVDDEGDYAGLFTKERTGLVPIKAQAVALTDFSKLVPPTAIWLTLIFDLVKEKYLEGNHELSQLSYTAEMMRVPHLLAGPQSALVKTGLYQPLILDPLEHKDLDTDTLSKKQEWDRGLLKANQWMLDKYGSLVPDTLFNLIGGLDRHALVETECRLALPGETGEVFVDEEESERSLFWENTREEGVPVRSYKTMDPLSFGSAEALERDRQWTARRNLCRAVQHLADREFEKTSDSILKSKRGDFPKASGWYVDRVLERQDVLIERAVLGEWFYEMLEPFDIFQHEAWVNREAQPQKNVRENLVSFRVGKGWSAGLNGRNIGWPKIHIGDWADQSDCYRCPLTGVIAGYHATINPKDAESLALVLGCTFEDLPWQLQVWQAQAPDHRGNPILNRCDPAEWALRNPWTGASRYWRGDGFDLSIGISLSRRAVNRIRKKLGLPKLDWKTLEARDKPVYRG